MSRFSPEASLQTRIARRFEAAVLQASLSRAERTKINAALIRAGMDGNGRFRSTGEALGKIAGVLGVFGIEWDEVINSFTFGRPKGRETIRLARQTEDPFSPISIENTSLSFHWETLESGVEVIAYLG